MSKFDQIAAEAPALEASVDAVLNALRNPESSGLRAEQLQALLSHAVTAYAKLRETNDGLPDTGCGPQGGTSGGIGAQCSLARAG